MESYLTVILIAAGILLLTALAILRTGAEEKKKLIARRHRTYGHINIRPVSSEALAARRQESLAAGGPFGIDDITWHDLDGDRLYTAMNTCVSAPGESRLYDRLRRPAMDEDTLMPFVSLIDHYGSDETCRDALWLILSGIHFPKEGISVLRHLTEAAGIMTGPGLILAVLTAVSITGLFIRPVPCLIAFIVLTGINIAWTLKDNTRPGPVCEALCFLRDMITAGRKIAGLHAEDKTAAEAYKHIGRLASSLSPLLRGSAFIAVRSQATGGIGAAVMTYINLFFHLDRLFLGRLAGLAVEKNEEIRALAACLGDHDAAAACASYRLTLTKSCRAEFSISPTEAGLWTEDLVHPFLEDPVPNSAVLTGGTLMTGANASGKSTFLKSCALAAWLAQTTGTAPAASYRAPFFRIMTSMALKDDLTGGASYFVVEIRSIKRLLEAAKEEKPLLIIIDEVLRGTNTIERIASSAQILRAMVKPWTVVLAATHDRELTVLLRDVFRNRHFEEKLGASGISFTYKLMDGPACATNALTLLSAEGYDKSIVDSAKIMAAHFEETGEWQI